MKLFTCAITFILTFVGITHSLSDDTDVGSYYELGVSYEESGKTEDALKAFAQVAFFYPNSDLADNALYQIALIRERMADKEQLLIKEKQAQMKSPYPTGREEAIKADIDNQISLAMLQYTLATDNLKIIIQKYPESDIYDDATAALQRIMFKNEYFYPDKQITVGKVIAIVLVVVGAVLFITTFTL